MVIKMRNVLKIKSEKKQKEVILLNKPFLGDWLDDAKNIGHEIIDFLKTDNGDLYIYNNPYGQAPKSCIGIKDKKKKYDAQYLVLTGKENAKEKSFEILYVIELEKLLHKFSSTKHKKKEKRSEKEEKELRQRQKEIIKIIEENGIKYNGKLLNEIYKNDDSLYVTFKASKIYRAIVPIKVQMNEYDFRRNKGYLFEDKDEGDFKALKNSIIDDKTKSINRTLYEEFEPSKVDSKSIINLNKSKTFIDLTLQKSNEQIFTNMLFSLFDDGGLFKLFCDYFKGNRTFDASENYRVFRENKIVEGRMDICGDSEKQRVVIENKINSGLNGLKPRDSETQLTKYYRWAKEDKRDEPLCFIIVPDARKRELENEIEKRDPQMKSIYLIVTYKNVSEFLEKNKINLKDYLYERYVDDMIMSFSNLSKLTKENIYVQMFTEETLK